MNNKKSFLISFCFIFLFLIIGNVFSFTGGGSGTVADPYQITDWYELNETRNNLTANYILMNDLDSSTSGYQDVASPSSNGGNGWRVIGDDAGGYQFLGNFTGENYSISDIYILASGDSGIGLFAFLGSGSSVKNLGIRNITISAANNLGGLSGLCSGTIDQVYVYVNLIEGSNGVGGICGNHNGTISESFTLNGNLSASTNYGGGLVGTNYLGIIQNSYSNVSVNGVRVGGLVGENYFAGTSVNNSYSSGRVIGSIAGGLIGSQGGGANISLCYYDTNTSGQSDNTGKGVPKTTPQMQNISTFTGWDIVELSSWTNEIWYIDDTNDYPRLGWENSIFSPDSITVTLVSPSNGSSVSAISDFVANMTIETEIGTIFTNATWYLWNSDGSLNTTIFNNNISGIYNQTIFSHTFIADGIYHWNVLVKNNNSQLAWASNNWTIQAFTNIPSINLQAPTDNQFFNSELNINFSFTPEDDNLESCMLYGNWNGSWHLNQTISATNFSSNDFTSLNLTEGSYIWNVKCNDTNENTNFGLTNYTFTIDLTNPTATINSITTTAGSQTVTASTNSTDANLDKCNYTIYTLGGGEDSPPNSSFNCNSDFSFATSGFATYNLSITSVDLAGNYNQTSTLFTVSASTPVSPGGGGGGTTTVVIGGEQTFDLTTQGGGDRYQYGMVKSSSESRDLLFENLIGSALDIELTCEDQEGSICQYLTFSEDSFSLPVGQEIKTKKSFTITLPDSVLEEKFIFTIIAKDGTTTDFITIQVDMKSGLGSFFTKLGLSKKVGNLSIPYVLIFIISILAFGFFSNILILKPQKIKGNIGIALIIGILGGFLSVILL